MRGGLGGDAFGARGRCTDELVGPVGVDEGVLEQAEPELLPQQPPDRDVERSSVTLPARTRRTSTSGDALAAELVDPGVQGT